MSEFKRLMGLTRRPDYLCGDFVIDAHKALYGQDLPKEVQYALSSRIPSSFLQAKDSLKSLKRPQEGAIISFWREGGLSHVGLYYKRNVLHLAESSPQYMPLGILKKHYPRIRFYGVK